MPTLTDADIRLFIYTNMKEPQDIIPITLDVKHTFYVGDKRISIVPQTLAGMYICARLIDALEIDTDVMKANAALECLWLAESRREACARLVAYRTEGRKQDLLNEGAMEKLTKHIADNTTDEELATLLMLVLTDNQLAEFIKVLGIEEERRRMEKVQAAKKNDSTYVFGGKTVYGSLVSAVCEKYGWTYDYVLWGISYQNLQLMMADSVQTVYLSEEEKKQGNIKSPDAKKVKVTRANLAEIAKMFGQ